MFEKLKSWYLGNNRGGIGASAGRLLEDEAFIIAKESLQESLLQEFISSRPNELERREDIYKSYVIIDNITQELAKLMYASQEENQE